MANFRRGEKLQDYEYNVLFVRMKMNSNIIRNFIENKIISILIMTCSWWPSVAQCGKKNLLFLQKQFQIQGWSRRGFIFYYNTS